MVRQFSILFGTTEYTASARSKLTWSVIQVNLELRSRNGEKERGTRRNKEQRSCRCSAPSTFSMLINGRCWPLAFRLPHLAPMQQTLRATSCSSWCGAWPFVPAAARLSSHGGAVKFAWWRGRVPAGGGVEFRRRSGSRPCAFPFRDLGRRSRERGSPRRPAIPVTKGRDEMELKPWLLIEETGNGTIYRCKWLWRRRQRLRLYTMALFRLKMKIFWMSHRMCRKDVGRGFRN